MGVCIGLFEEPWDCCSYKCFITCAQFETSTRAFATAQQQAHKTAVPLPPTSDASQLSQGAQRGACHWGTQQLGGHAVERCWPDAQDHAQPLDTCSVVCFRIQSCQQRRHDTINSAVRSAPEEHAKGSASGLAYGGIAVA